MIISFNDLITKKNIDIKVNSDQKIKDTLEILIQNGFLANSLTNKNRKVKSHRQEDFVNIEMTYNQEKIYYGDILYIYE